jgi:hypothetical protein
MLTIRRGQRTPRNLAAKRAIDVLAKQFGQLFAHAVGHAPFNRLHGATITAVEKFFYCRHTRRLALGTGGKPCQALQSYRASLAPRERLVKSDPGNPLWQRDLALSHGAIAMVLARQGAKREATAAFEKGHAIIVRLMQQSPDNATLPKDLAWFEAQLADLKK